MNETHSSVTPFSAAAKSYALSKLVDGSKHCLALKSSLVQLDRHVLWR